ncbi:MAG: TlpA disulfide reductase family protein [Proteobacteria bacterium]|nr:TlpA disulfide reductase family protein [Pseudomonadota bacterium]
MLAFAISVAAGASGCQSAPEVVPPGNVAQTLVAPTVGDAVFDPATLEGKPAVIMFVSPTCGHCMIEIPRAQEAAAAKGASTVAVFVSGNADAAIAAVQRTKFTGTVLVDDGTLRAKYNVRAVPYTLVLNRDGTAHSAFRGEQDAETIKNAIAAASI